jgi:hypothetical protein
MGKVVRFQPGAGKEKTVAAGRVDKRLLNRDDYVRGQQVLANAIFHWKNDAEPDARAAVKFLLHHLATAFRADDAPLHPKPVKPSG